MNHAREWLDPGRTCWRVENATRFSVLMENGTYFKALESSLKKARHSIMLLGWQFDPRTRLDVETRPGDHSAQVGHLLRRVIKENPDLDVRLLLWSSPLLIAASQGFFPQRAQRWFRKRIADFRLDRPGPLGACHHQKVVVIDDKIAFVGGGDISTDRWDSCEHLDDDPRRCMPSGVIAPPRHEVMCVMEGPAAMMMGDLARARWARATWEETEPVEASNDPWPEGLAVDLTDTPVAVMRTEPAWRDRPAVCENQHMHVEAIRRAKSLIYLENQYFTSPHVADALAKRLAEPDGPEIVLVSTAQSPSWFDSLTMDTARAEVLYRLETADVHGRFSAFSPLTASGGRVIVHSKVTIIDDCFLRIGSTNLNNRSMGYDTECDVATTPPTAEGQAFVKRMRQRLIGHFLGLDEEVFAAAEAVSRSVGDAIVSFGAERMRILGFDRPTSFARWVAEYQLGDPHGPGDAWRPWKRRRTSQIGKLRGVGPQREISKSTTSGT